MHSLFENVGHTTSHLDQEDCINTYNTLRDFLRRAENKDAVTLLDIKDAYLYVRNAPMPSQLAIKDFTAIALKSPATNFTGYQPRLAKLDPNYIETSIIINKQDFVKTYTHTWAQGICQHTKKNKYRLFGWFFTGHIFPTKATTKSGYPAWLPLKYALDIPNIQDLAEFDPIQLGSIPQPFPEVRGSVQN